MPSQSGKLYALLKLIRQQRKLSQNEVAERIGVAQSSISKFEVNHAKHLDELVRYAAALDVELSVLVRVGRIEIRHDLIERG